MPSNSLTFSVGNILKLNVGGTIFQTSRATLTKYDCMFRTMLETHIPLEADSSGCIFIDRDPTNFQLILNFMRDGQVEIPEKFVKEVLAEAQFYLLEGLIEQCQTIINEIIVVNNFSDLLKVLEKAEKDVLVYSLGSSYEEGLHTYKVSEVKHFAKKYREKCQFLFRYEDMTRSHKLDYYPFNGPDENFKITISDFFQKLDSNIVMHDSF